MNPGRASTLAALLATLALVAVVTGGGGRAPWSAASWQSAALLALGLAAAAHASRCAAQDDTLRWIARATAAFAGWIALSASLGVHRSSAAQQAAAWIAALALGGACALIFASRERAQIAPFALLASSAALLVVAIGHLGAPLGGRAGATPVAGDGSRPLGTFADPNHLTAFLVLTVAVHCRWAGGRGIGAVHLVLCSVAGLAALGTSSRLAALSLLCIGAAELARRGALSAIVRSRRALALSVLMAVVAVAALSATLVARQGDRDAWTRPHIWRAASGALDDRPVTGLGPAGFQHAWQPYNFPVERGLSRFGKNPTTPHSEALRVPIELGWIGAALALALAAFVIRGLRSPVESLPLAAGCVPFLAVHDAFHSAATAAWVAAAIGLLLAESSRAGESALEPRDPARRRTGVMILAACLAIALALGWRWRVARAESAWLEGSAPSALALALALDSSNPDFLQGLAPLVAGTAPDLAVRDLRADAVLEEAERLAPRDPRPVVERARLLRRGARSLFPDEGTRASVHETYARAARLAPHDATLRVETAAALLQMGDPESAARWAGDALTLEPAMIRAHALRVLALAETNSANLGSARVALEAAVEAGAAVEAARDTSPYERDLLECEDDLLQQALSSQ